MSLSVTLLISVLDLGAVFFNGRLLLSCFRRNTKYKFVQKCWMLASLQAASQVAILVADGIEWWNGFQIQPTESCNVFRVLSLSMLFFQICIPTAIVTVCYEHLAGHEERKSFSCLSMYTVLLLGFLGSAIIFWHCCFTRTPTSQAVLKVALILTMSFVVYLLSTALAKSGAEYNKEITSLKSNASMNSRLSSWSWKAWEENKESLFLTVLFTACLTLIFIGAAHANPESALWGRDLKGEMLFNGIVYHLIRKFCVGTGLPVTVYYFINLSYSGKKERDNIIETI